MTLLAWTGYYSNLMYTLGPQGPIGACVKCGLQCDPDPVHDQKFGLSLYPATSHRTGPIRTLTKRE
jgi:hypothetical protein